MKGKKSTFPSNHRSLPQETTLAEDFSLPSWLKMRPFGERPGWGEDTPIWEERLVRDGWQMTSQGKLTKQDFKAKVWMEFDPPIAFRRPHPQQPKRYKLEMTISGFNEKEGPAYLTEHSILCEKGAVERLGRSEWADWSQQGDLVFAKGVVFFDFPAPKVSWHHLTRQTKSQTFPASNLSRERLHGRHGVGQLDSS